METNQVDLVAAAVFGRLYQVVRAVEPRLTGQVIGDVRHPDGGYRVHDDMSPVHGVPASDLDVEPLPNPDAASDPAASNALTKTFGEHHDDNLVTIRQINKDTRGPREGTS